MKKIFSIIFTLTTACLFLIKPVLAAGEGLGCGGGLGPIADFLCNKVTGNDIAASKENVGSQVNTLIGGIIGFLTILAALWFGIHFIMAGFKWISAGGDKTALETARSEITNSLIGLIIVVSAWIIMGVIGEMLGLEILNPGKVLQGIGI